MSADPIAAVADLELSDEVRTFCRRHDLLGHLGRAVELARQHFSIVGEPSVRLEQDPDDGEWYLDLEIRARGDEGEMIECQRRYTRSWALSTPWPAVHLITLLCALSEE